MNTKINLTYKGVDYTLEYDRMSVKVIENNGFELEAFAKQPMKMIELAFAGAFVKNHRKMKQSLIDEIYKSCPNKDKLIETLSQMIEETYSSLTEEPESNDEGNAKWEIAA